MGRRHPRAPIHVPHRGRAVRLTLRGTCNPMATTARYPPWRAAATDARTPPAGTSCLAVYGFSAIANRRACAESRTRLAGRDFSCVGAGQSDHGCRFGRPDRRQNSGWPEPSRSAARSSGRPAVTPLARARPELLRGYCVTPRPGGLCFSMTGLLASVVSVVHSSRLGSRHGRSPSDWRPAQPSLPLLRRID